MYLGNTPALSYTSFAKQDFTTSATTSYTLDNPVTNANELALFINFVRQEPTTAYSASGTSLTLTSATSASDDMYCVFLGKAVQTVNPPNASVGLSQLTATGTKDATTFLRGDNTFASAGGDNTPAFKAYLASNQTISSGAFTKALFATEAWDTNSAFASNKFTVPAGEGGKYVFTYNLLFYYLSDNTRFEARLYKNGSSVGGTTFRETGSNSSQQVDMSYSVVVEASAADYFEVYVQHTAVGNQTLYGPNNGDSSFTGYKLIGV